VARVVGPEPAPPAAPARVAEPTPVPPPPPAAAPAEPPAQVASAPPQDGELLPHAPRGAPVIQLSFLVYSRVPERRRVAVSIAGGNMVTLHEGEAAGDVQVVRILPDGIHVRYQGALFAVHPRD